MDGMDSHINSVESLKREASQFISVSMRALKRIRKKLEKQEQEKAEAERYLWFSQIADSLVANPHVVKRGASIAMIENIYTMQVEEVGLDPAKSVFENAKDLYNRARKGKRGLKIIEEHISLSKKEEQDIIGIKNEAETIVSSAEDGFEALSESVGALRTRLQNIGILPRIAHREAGGRPEEENVPYRHLTIDGWNVFIGKNDAQNDEISTRFAKPWDIWMHVAAHAGSHVVVRREKNAEWPPKDILVKAAQFAVWFSKAKHTSYAEVNVTEARFVRKRRHAPPGEVIAERCKTLRVSPKSPQEAFRGQENQDT